MLTEPQDMASPKTTGVILVLVSALVFSSCGLFVKSLAADAWAIIFWRGFFATVFTVGYVLVRGEWNIEFTKMGRPGIAAGIVGAIGTMAFIPSYKFTTVANVSLIYAAAPLVAACLAWLWYREKTSGWIISCSLTAMAGVLLIMSQSLASVHLRGDILAAWMTVCMAAVMCIYRRFPDTPAAGPAILMSLLLMPVSVLFTAPMAVSGGEILILALFGFAFSIASVTLAEGAKRLPSAETALLSAMETPLAILLAILLLSEYPGLITVIGGSIVMLAVVASQKTVRSPPHVT